MDQLQHSLLTLPSRWCSSFPTHTLGWFFSRNKTAANEGPESVTWSGCRLVWAVGMRIHSSLEGGIHGFQHVYRPTSVSSSVPRSTQEHPFSGSQMSVEPGNDPIHPLFTAFVHVLPISCREKRENWITLFNWHVGRLLFSYCKLLLDSCYLDF